MAVPRFQPQANKILTPLVVAAGALLFAAAPPNAVAPEGKLLSCAPNEADAASALTAPRPLDPTQEALVQHLSRRFFIASGATERMVIAIESRFNPKSNIQIGARIIQECVHRTGTLEAGLQFYNGALRDNSAQYAQKVLAERSRLGQVLRSRNLRFGLASSI